MSHLWSEESEAGQGCQGSQQLSCQEGSFRERYLFVGGIAEGGFGKVKLAIHLLTGTEVAVKVLEKGGRASPFIMTELDIMKAVQHPNIIQLFQVIETRERVYVVMEHASGGDLLQHLPKTGGMQEAEALRVFWEIACAVGYCHQKGVVHRDLKPKNIMLDAQGHVKIIDFGLGCRVRPGEKLHEVCGTFPYWAPEVCQREAYDGPAADIWSLGVILHLIVTGDLPFKESTPVTKKQILHARHAFPTYLAKDIHSLIFDMLRLKPMKRLTIDQILEHPWLKQEEGFPSPSSEPVSNHISPKVLMAMVDIGFNLHQIWLSLKNKKFNDEMATYLMLQNKLSQDTGTTLQVIPMFHKVTGDFSSENLPLVRRASEPALGAVPSLPSEQIEKGKQSRLKVCRGNSVPAIFSFSLVPGTHPFSVPWHDGPVVPPLSPYNVGDSENSRCSQELPPQEPSSSFSSPGSPRHGTAASWKRVARRMACWVADICCCCCCCCCCCRRAPRTGPAINKVCSVERGQRGPAGKNKIFPAGQ